MQGNLGFVLSSMFFSPDSGIFYLAGWMVGQVESGKRTDLSLMLKIRALDDLAKALRKKESCHQHIAAQ